MVSCSWTALSIVMGALRQSFSHLGVWRSRQPVLIADESITLKDLARTYLYQLCFLPKWPTASQNSTSNRAMCWSPQMVLEEPLHIPVITISKMEQLNHTLIAFIDLFLRWHYITGLKLTLNFFFQLQCVYVYPYATACIWWSEQDQWESVLSFHQEGLDHTQVAQLGSKCLYLLTECSLFWEGHDFSLGHCP